MSTTSEVLNAALSLGPQQRSEIAHQLLLSLEPTGSEENVDQAWAEEIRRRLQAIRSGQTTLCDWDDALAALRQESGAKGSA